MPAEALHVRGVRIQSVPGLDGGDLPAIDGISPGIHLFHGPNGIGKTSLARALSGLLWGNETSGWLSALLTRGTEQWELEQQGHRRLAKRGGLPADVPVWEPPEARARHHWSLRELMDSGDEDLARQIAKAMSGGVDLDAAARDLGWDSAPSLPRKRAQELRDAERRVYQVRAEQQALFTRSEQQQRLQGEIDTLRTRVRALPLLRAAQEFQDRQAELQTLRDRLANAPPAMEQLREEDGVTLDTLLEQIQRIRLDLRHTRAALERLSAPAPGLSPALAANAAGLLHEIPEALRQREPIRQTLERTRQEHLRLQTRCEQLRSRLGLDDETRSRDYHCPDLRRYLDLRLRAEAAAARAGLPPGAPLPEDTPDPDALRARIDALRRHLLSHPGKHPLWLLSLLILLSLTGYLAYWQLEDWWLFLPALPVLLFLADLLRRHRHRPHGETSPEAMLALQEQFLKATALREAQSLFGQLQTLTNSLDGFQPTPDPLWAAHWLEDLQNWRRLLPEREAARTLAEDAAKTLAGFDARLSEQLEQQDTDPEQVWARLRPRLAAEQQRQNELDQTQREETRLQQELAERRDELQRLLSRTRLEPPDPAELRRRLELLPGWTRDFRRSEELDNRLSELRKQLQDDPSLLERDADALRDEEQSAMRADETLQAKTEEWARVDQDIQTVQKRFDLHEALEAAQEARAALETERETYFNSRVGRLLIDWLKEQARTLDRPRVFARANEHLARFTAGALQLDFRNEQFLAGEPGHAPRPLNALSTGERAQALMAVRLAFLDHSETVRMPLFVDEALGTSDDERSARIIRALIETARQGRQILYFTAQGDELDKWRQALAESGVVFAETDLGALRGQTAAETRPLSPRQTPPPTPRPAADESPDAWARRVGIPEPDPYAPVEDAHLFHIVREPAACARLMDQGITGWGALKVLLEHGGGKELDTDELKRRAAALDARHRAWRIGRPPPVRPSELAASDAVTERYQDAVAQLLNEVNGDAGELIARLEQKAVSGFRSANIDRLRDYFAAQGLLSGEPPLGDEEIAARERAAYER